MSRLTERYSDGTPFVPERIVRLTNGLSDVIKKLAHYENLEDDGRLIELPCPIGTTVYLVHRYNDRLHEYFPDEPKYSITATTFDALLIDSFGDTVFLTREEAEAKLAELKGGVE